MSHAAVTLANCPNCGRPLEGAYCAECGQKAAPLNPTAHDFMHDLVHELLHVDGKIFRSVHLLLTRPGFLTHEYFQGRRIRYVSPIRLYLIFSVIYFALAAVAPARPQDAVQVKVTGDDTEEELKELRERGFESVEALERAANDAINKWAPRAMFVLVPLFALLVKGVTGRGGRNYPQHLYFAFHIHAAAFALLTVGVVARFVKVPYVADVVGAAMTVWLVVYGVLAFRRAYGGTTARAVLRTAVVALVYVTAIGITIAAMVVPIVAPLLR